MSVHYDLTADSGDLVSEMRSATSALDRTRVAGDRASASTKTLGKESRKTATLLQAFKEAAEGVGGKAGESAGRVEKFGKAFAGVASVGGPVGIAVGAAGAGIAAMGGAAIAAALNTTALVEEMRKAQKTIPVTDGQLAQVREMDREVAGLKDDFNALVVEIGAEVAPAIADVVGGFRDAWHEIKRTSKEVEDFRRGLMAVLSLGGTEVWNWWTEPDEALERYNRTIRENRKELEKNTRGHDEVGRVAIRRTEDMSRKAAAHTEAVKRQRDAVAELERLYQESADSVLTEEQRIIAAYDRRISKIGELVNAGGDQFTAAAARAAAEAQMQRDLANLQQSTAEEYVNLEWQKSQAANEAAAQAQRAAFDRTQAELQAAGQIAGAIQMVADRYARASGEMTEEAKRRALIAFRISQAAAIAQIAINTAQAIMQGYAQLGPVAGNISAVAMSATGVVQSGLVLAEPAPQFDQGGMVRAPDHFPASLQRGEAVLTPSGVANAGGEEGVRAMNQGRGGGGMQEVAFVRIGHRWFDAISRRHLERDGPIARAIRDATGPIGHRVVYG